MLSLSEANDLSNRYCVFGIVFVLGFYICCRITLKSFQEYLNYKTENDENIRANIRLENIKIDKDNGYETE